MAELVPEEEKENGYSCKLCYEIYGENLRPHTLPCGHSFCTGCIVNLLKNGTVSCPKCKREHRGANENDFPINYDLEELMFDSKLAILEEASKGLAKGCGTKIQTFITDQKNGSEALIVETNDLESQIKHYQEYLNNMTKEHEEWLKKIHDVARMNEAVMKMIEEEHKALGVITNELNVRRRVFQGKVENLENSSDTKSALEAISDLDESFSSLEEWNKSCREKLPNGKVITTSQKVVNEVKCALSLIDSKSHEVLSEVPDFSRSKFTISEKISKLLGQGTITIKRLQKMSEVTANLLNEGLVYAVHTKEGSVCSAKLSLKGDKLYLHHLKAEAPPSNAHTVLHSELMGNLNRFSSLVFMDLEWDGEVRGRVHILLAPQTPYAQQFLALCTGVLGPTYARCKFFSISSKGNTVHELVVTGDYEHNNGNGGASVIKGLEIDEEQYKRPFLSGSVCMYRDIGDNVRSAQFCITTGSGTPSSTKNNIFGQVQDGLDTVRLAAKVNYIQNVEIADCGVVVPL